jgi:hypothetical protein
LGGITIVSIGGTAAGLDPKFSSFAVAQSHDASNSTFDTPNLATALATRDGVDG